MMTDGGASPTLAEWDTLLGTGGARNTQFQAFVDVFCKTAAHGGMLDTYVSEGWDVGQGLRIYAFLIATYPVTGINYRDVANLSALETVLNALFDAQISAGVSSPGWASIAMAYDWAFGSLNGTRRGQAITYLQTPTSDFSAGPLHHRRAVDALQHHFAGYVYEGDTGDTDSATRIALRSSSVTGTTGVRAAESFVAGTAGGETSGFGYFLTELDWHGMGLLMYADSYRTATGDASGFASGVDTVIEYFPQWMAYMLAPYQSYGGFGVGWGAGYVLTKSSESQDLLLHPTLYPYATTFVAPFLAAVAKRYASTNSTMASLARWLLENLLHSGGTISSASGDAYTLRFALWVNFLYYNTVSPSSPSSLSLPIAKHFDPLGFVVIRDGWNFDGTNSMLKVWGQPYAWTNSGYGQAANGIFSLHRRVPLVIEPGAGAHSPLQETGWAGSTIIFPKPGESTVGSTWDQGGARHPSSWATTDATTDWVPAGSGGAVDMGGFKSGTGRVDLTDGSANHPYSALYADLTRSYNGPTQNDGVNSQKVSNFERQIVRFPPPTPGTDPGFTVIFDRVTTTGTDVEPRWLLYPGAHSNPATRSMTISGHSSTGTTTRNSYGTTHYNGSGGTMQGLISINDSSYFASAGKAFWSPLLPASARIIERGGPNGSNLLGQTDSHEWESPYGVQPTDFIAHTMIPFEGNWRYELLYQTTVADAPFLNVIEDVEPSASSRTTLTTLSGTNTTGVRIDRGVGNRLAAIFKTSAGTLSSGTFNLDAAGTYDVLLADVPASTALTFTKGSNITAVTHIATGDTDLTYTTTAQRTIWLRIVVGSNGSGASNAISFS